MKVLVTAASKYGATAEIAQAVGDVLAKRGLEVIVLPIEEVTSIDDYPAIILGSAVYAGHWLKPAREFVDRNEAGLASRTVWLFSSGPVGDPPKPDEEPVEAAPLVKVMKALDHRVFAGKLDKKNLNFGEKAIVMALRAPEGDFRNWDDIQVWASAIADQLEGVARN
jgi:menaquinone-dependent protoporphyrinogen oxidase